MYKLSIKKLAASPGESIIIIFRIRTGVLCTGSNNIFYFWSGPAVPRP